MVNFELQQMFAKGMLVKDHFIVSDDQVDIERIIRFAVAHHDAIILCGGWGQRLMIELGMLWLRCWISLWFSIRLVGILLKDVYCLWVYQCTKIIADKPFSGRFRYSC